MTSPFGDPVRFFDSGHFASPGDKIAWTEGGRLCTGVVLQHPDIEHEMMVGDRFLDDLVRAAVPRSVRVTEDAYSRRRRRIRLPDRKAALGKCR